MKSSLAAVSAIVLCLAAASPVEGRGRRRMLAVSPPQAGLSLTFIGGELLDAGPIHGRTERKVTLRIGPATREPRGTATIRAYVETAGARCTIRVDGITLGTAPRLVRRHVPIGIPFTHRIDIDVPPEAAEGPLQTSIGWEVTTE